MFFVLAITDDATPGQLIECEDFNDAVDKAILLAKTHYSNLLDDEDKARDELVEYVSLTSNNCVGGIYIVQSQRGVDE